MHYFMLFCLAPLVSAQYNYGPGVNSDTTLGVNNIESPLVLTQPAVEEYNKVFYTYSAPEQEFDDVNAEEQLATAVKKNLRVIFIKGPENTAMEKAALQLAKNAIQDYTAIYVLSKQSDISSLASKLQEIKSQNTAKPEVHFVKYRTQADAETAQRVIQAQYDDIRGTSSNNGPDTASVLDFASKSDLQANVNNVNTKAPVVAKTRTAVAAKSSSRNAYLPPSKRY